MQVQVDDIKSTVERVNKALGDHAARVEQAILMVDKSVADVKKNGEEDLKKLREIGVGIEGDIGTGSRPCESQAKSFRPRLMSYMQGFLAWRRRTVGPRRSTRR